MKKRVLAVIMAVMMVSAMAVACGNEEAAPVEDTETPEAGVEAPAETEETQVSEETETENAETTETESTETESTEEAEGSENEDQPADAELKEK